MQPAPAVFAPFHTYPDMTSLSHAATASLTTTLDAALARHDTVRLALSGGRTPAAAYRQLAATRLDWARVVATLVDERFVPPTDPDSNERFITENFLIGPAASCQFIPFWRSDGSADDCANAIDTQIAAWPRAFDAIVLGMGEDGHTASLFPGVMSTPLRHCMVVPEARPAPPQTRLTLTMTTILTAQKLILIVTGGAKHDLLHAVLGGAHADLPIAQVLRGTAGRIEIFWAPAL